MFAQSSFRGGTRLSRLLAAGAAVLAFGLLAGTAAGSAAAATVRPARASGTPACAASGVVVWLNTSGSGAAGSTYYNLELTNLSGRSCTLGGYAAVSGVDLGHKALGSPANHSGPKKPARVTLGKDGNAHSVLQIVVVQNYPASSCRPVEAAGLGVKVPGGSSAEFVPFPFSACAKAGDRYLSIGPVLKGLGTS